MIWILFTLWARLWALFFAKATLITVFLQVLCHHSSIWAPGPPSAQPSPASQPDRRKWRANGLFVGSPKPQRSTHRQPATANSKADNTNAWALLLKALLGTSSKQVLQDGLQGLQLLLESGSLLVDSAFITNGDSTSYEAPKSVGLLAHIALSGPTSQGALEPTQSSRSWGSSPGGVDPDADEELSAEPTSSFPASHDVPAHVSTVAMSAVPAESHSLQLMVPFASFAASATAAGLDLQGDVDTPRACSAIKSPMAQAQEQPPAAAICSTSSEEGDGPSALEPSPSTGFQEPSLSYPGVHMTAVIGDVTALLTGDSESPDATSVLPAVTITSPSSAPKQPISGLAQQHAGLPFGDALCVVTAAGASAGRPLDLSALWADQPDTLRLDMRQGSPKSPSLSPHALTQITQVSSSSVAGRPSLGSPSLPVPSPMLLQRRIPLPPTAAKGAASAGIKSGSVSPSLPVPSESLLARPGMTPAGAAKGVRPSLLPCSLPFPDVSTTEYTGTPAQASAASKATELTAGCAGNVDAAVISTNAAVMSYLGRGNALSATSVPGLDGGSAMGASVTTAPPRSAKRLSGVSASAYAPSTTGSAKADTKPPAAKSCACSESGAGHGCGTKPRFMWHTASSKAMIKKPK